MRFHVENCYIIIIKNSIKNIIKDIIKNSIKNSIKININIIITILRKLKYEYINIKLYTHNNIFGE